MGRLLYSLLAFSGAALILAGAGMAGLNAWHRQQLDWDALEAAGEAQLERAAALRTIAADFDPAVALASLPPNPKTGTVLRFDTRLESARIQPPPSDDAAPPPRSLQFEFDGEDPIRLAPAQSDYALEDGVLRIRTERDDPLLTRGDFDSGGDAIAEISVRIRLSRGRAFSLGWSRAALTEWDPESVRLLEIGVVPDGEFHVYNVAAEHALKMRRGDHARTLALIPSDVAGDDVEVDWIRLVRKRDKYARQAVGRTQELFGHEMRSAIHVRTPRMLAFDVVVPEKDPRLDVGMGLLDGDATEFLVELETPDGSLRTLAREQVARTETWRDSRIPLAEFAGQTVTLHFRAEGSEGAVALWSSPRLSSAPDELFQAIVVVQDALRADHLSAWGHERQTSPTTDALAAGGVLFEHAFSQATKTRASVPSYMTSLLPTTTGVWNSHDHLADRYLTLAEVLRSQGFVTASFIQNLNAGPAAGVQQGFDFLHKPTTSDKKPAGVYPRAIDWIRDHADRNFFLYLHVLDPHGAYDPPAPYDAWYREQDTAATPIEIDRRLDPAFVETPTTEGRRARYDGEILQGDAWLARLRSELDDLGIGDETLLVLFSDHGEHLSEHGLWEHTPPGFKQVLHVPLLFHHPKLLPPGVRRDEPTQLLDVMPTVLELAGIDPKQLPLQGDSLLPLARGEAWPDRVAISEEVISYDRSRPERVRASLFFRRWHLLWSRHEGERTVRAFDYHADPQEERPLATAAWDRLLRRDLLALLRNLKESNLQIWREMTRGAAEAVPLDPETQEQLRALGYID
ncbi:MAG: sulfatase [Myxococcota bacterium]